MTGPREGATPDSAPGRLDPELAWVAVLARDARYDGRFVYAVRSTRIFCRPTCPSRRPHRKHAMFFGEPAQARAAGYRPCRRCRPESSVAPAAAIVERTRAYIDAHVTERLTLGVLAPIAGISPAHLQRTFKAALGLSPRDYVRGQRAERFKSKVRQGRSVTDALYESGYGSGSRLYEGADAHLGMTPGAYRRGGNGQLIRYTIAAAELGRVLVASTERGVCAVQFGDSDHALEDSLRREYPNAELQRDDAAVRASLAAILAHLTGDLRRLDLRLDVVASGFQWRVWRALQAIPYGETRSYAQVAAALGRPSAARAVARACATNPVALLVPCHRVVRADGARGGYRWGESRKRLLLLSEKNSTAGAGR